MLGASDKAFLLGTLLGWGGHSSTTDDGQLVHHEAHHPCQHLTHLHTATSCRHMHRCPDKLTTLHCCMFALPQQLGWTYAHERARFLMR